MHCITNSLTFQQDSLTLAGAAQSV